MPKATAIFDADDSRLQRAVKRIDRSLLDIEKKFASAGAFAAKLLAGPAIAAAALGVGIKEALDVGGHFADLQANTGIAIADAMALEQEFRNAGKAGEDVTSVIGKMQKTIATGTANGVIKDMKVDLDALKKASPVDQFHILGKAITALESPLDRGAAATAIFGKSGNTLLSMFASKGFGEAAQQVGEQAAILQRDAALFDDVSDKLGLAGLKTQGFFVGVADKVVPVLKPLLDRFASLDLTAIGGQIGDAIAVVAEAISSDEVGSLITDSLELSFARAINFLAGGLLSLPARFGALFTRVIGDIHESMVKDILKQISLFPGTAGYVAAQREKLAGSLADNERQAQGMDAVAARAMHAIFNEDMLREKLGETIGSLMESAQSKQAAALAAVPTTLPVGGVPSLDLGTVAAANVSALTRVGGNFGGGADPLLEANRLASEGNGLLREIRAILAGPDSRESNASFVYA